MASTSPPTPLPTRRLGDSNLEVSVVGLGCNNFGRRLDLDGTEAVLNAALEAGITLLDTADIYGGAGASERLIGEALKGRTNEFVIATKFGMQMREADDAPDSPRGSRDYIRWALEGSLRRLGVEKIDLYQYHQPDGITPIAVTLSALNELVEEGLVAAIGCSNFSAAQLEEAERVARDQSLARFVSLQNEYSLLERAIETDVAPTCERFGVSILPYFPLASGLLSGKYRRGEPAPEGSRLASAGEAASEKQYKIIEALAAFAARRGVSILDVAIAALAAQPAVGSVIAGATKPAQVVANVAALLWRPGADDLAELDRIAPTARSRSNAPLGNEGSGLD
jgi:aryl-alcohol dehydrogenase-like predicted oxidoreductase